jgi:predicted Zn-dependent protease
MSNESGMDLAIDYPRLPGRVRFSVTGVQDIPVVATWPANAGPNQVGWTIVLTRKDGQAFTAGEYKIDISMTAAYELMRTPSGKALRGIEHQSAGLFVLIKEPTNAREKSAAYRLLGKRKLAADASEGLRFLVLATQADPTDLGALIDLAHAYVKTGRCREAIPIFERGVQRLKDRRAGQHNTLPYSLAHAYVCVGNEQRAAQVLREGGVSEESLKDTIARFRKTVPK